MLRVVIPISVSQSIVAMDGDDETSRVPTIGFKVMSNWLNDTQLVRSMDDSWHDAINSDERDAHPLTFKEERGLFLKFIPTIELNPDRLIEVNDAFSATKWARFARLPNPVIDVTAIPDSANDRSSLVTNAGFTKRKSARFANGCMSFQSPPAVSGDQEIVSLKKLPVGPGALPPTGIQGPHGKSCSAHWYRIWFTSASTMNPLKYSIE